MVIFTIRWSILGHQQYIRTHKFPLNAVIQTLLVQCLVVQVRCHFSLEKSICEQIYFLRIRRQEIITPKMHECPLKRDHFKIIKGKFILQPSIFKGYSLVFVCDHLICTMVNHHETTKGVQHWTTEHLKDFPGNLSGRTISKVKIMWVLQISCWVSGTGLMGTWDVTGFFSGKSLLDIFLWQNFNIPNKSLWFFKASDLSPIHFRKQAATDGTYGSKYWFPGFGGLIQGQIYNSVFGSFTCIFITYDDRVIGSDFIR